MNKRSVVVLLMHKAAPDYYSIERSSEGLVPFLSTAFRREGGAGPLLEHRAFAMCGQRVASVAARGLPEWTHCHSTGRRMNDTVRKGDHGGHADSQPAAS
jgi:hypothetical protein